MSPILSLFPKKVSSKCTRAKVLSREAERRLDETYEDTGSLTRDGFSGYLGVPVETGILRT